MNPTDDQLNRLLRAAARASRELPAEASEQVRAGVMLAWRCAGKTEDAPDLLPMLRGALVSACLVALTALALGWFDSDRPSSDEAKLINAPLTRHNLP